MSHRFVRCPHCKLPHDAAERVCPTTGRNMPTESVHSRSRMSELPPPERVPEPLGFDPAKNRIPEVREPELSAEERRAMDTVQPSRILNLQQDLIGRTVSDRYIIRGILGEGGMGTVYEAEHMGLGRQVAIKVLNPAQAKKRVAVKRFQQEARAAGAIGHPNICEVYDLGLLDDGSPYLVMEKLTGTTLADRISREGGLPFDEITEVMIQVLSGLIAAHGKGIVHRDIKPENIFLARRVGCPPIVKILDFGVSKMMPQFQGGEEQLDLTRTGMVMGTPYYMSPEQARGERNLDGRVDVYACGVMMYESIVGKRPFLAPNYNALLLSIINTTPKALRDVRPATPAAMEAIVVGMMAKARDDRYPSANAVLHDIQALSGGARPPPAPPSADRLRAPVVRVARNRAAGGHDPNEGPGARLRSRMAEAPGPPQVPSGARPAQGSPGARPAQGSPGARPAQGPPGARSLQGPSGARSLQAPRNNEARPPDSGDNSTRIDHKRRDARTATAARPLPGSDSYEIPIHITGADLRPVAPAAAPGEYVDEMPTAVFRPGMRPGPASAPPTPKMVPVDFTDLTGDEWDSETEVKPPGGMTRHRERPPSEHAPKPFNPDDTVNLTGDIGIDVDFSDDAPPPRRSR